MEKIPSFTVNHLILNPGLYLSRTDSVADASVYTYDLRMSAPNREPVFDTGTMHSIEHLGATFLRNHPRHKDSIIYFGPMGCRTGFYLIVKDNLSAQQLQQLLIETFTFIQNYEGDIPGALPRDCGNYSDQNLLGAKRAGADYVKVLENLANLDFKYTQD